MKDNNKQQMMRGGGDREDSKQKRQRVLGPHHLRERQMEEGVGLRGGFWIPKTIVQCNREWNVVRRQVEVDGKEAFEFHPMNHSG